MLVSYNWLKQYVDLPDSLTPEELALKLTMSVVEVEGIRKIGESLTDIVVGKIKTIQEHPNADKLKICTVEFGASYPAQVVCGGSNIKEGMLCAFAGLGSKVRWHGEGELVELKKAKIRGVESYGMICASTEIGLGNMFPLNDEKEILDLTKVGSGKLKIGNSLAQALGLDDIVLDIDNKSMTHRPDLWGHYGLAREVAVAYHKKLAPYNLEEIKRSKDQKIKLHVDVQDKNLCPRYMAVAVGGVKIGSSPDWMQQKLLAVGLRPINNIVDITNYVMYDLGQPMHAFDKSKINPRSSQGQKSKVEIVVRRAKDGEKFTTLDEQEHELTSDILVIADSEKPIALAGVMGGMNSEISNDTKTIIFESANFDATNVRRTAMKLGLRTDSSARFEKSLDPHNAELALHRAVELTLDICPGAQVISNVVDENNSKSTQPTIELPLEFLDKKVGVKIEKRQVIKILESLGFAVEDKKDILKVTVPTWRATKDISIPEDLVEEVARVYGYGNIETTLPVFSIVPPERNELRLLERRIKNILASEFGFTESMNYSFVAPQLIETLGLSLEDYIELSNPMAKDRPYLRRSLIPNLLENLERNMHTRDEVALLEIGKVFRVDEPGLRVVENSDELLPRQDVMLGIVCTMKNTTAPFYEVSAALRGMMEMSGVEFRFEPVAVPENYMHPGRTAQILINKETIGFISELHPAVQQKFDIDTRVGLAEVNISRLSEYIKEKSLYKGLSPYPSVLRDIAFVVTKDISHEVVVKSIRDIDSLITEVELFDIFEGGQIEKSKKSMAYHIVYSSREKTLDAGEVDNIHKKIGRELKNKFGAEVRE